MTSFMEFIIRFLFIFFESGNVFFCLFQAALHALSMDGIDTQVVREKHFDDVLQHVRPSLTPAEVNEYAKIQIQSS